MDARGVIEGYRRVLLLHEQANFSAAENNCFDSLFGKRLYDLQVASPGWDTDNTLAQL